MSRTILHTTHYMKPDGFDLPTGSMRVEPIFETTLPETLGIRKFLEMSMADLREQLARAAKDPKINKRRFNEMKAHAVILTAWMVSALAMVDNMLAEAKAREPVQEAPTQ